jgi:Zinc carboxypeptidase
MRRYVTLALALVATALPAATASAFPVATDDNSYDALGRIFPDPLAGCVEGGPGPCSPNAQGNAPSTQFIGVEEFVEGIAYMNSKPEWQRYLEVWPLDGRRGANDGDDPPAASPAGAFEGNNLASFEFTPRTEYKSVGLPTTDRDRRRSDIYVLRVTDETVPDNQKKKYALSLSIHGIERAGAEGGTRAVEDLVTAFTTTMPDGRLKAEHPIVPEGTLPNAPTFGDVLKKMVIYFTYPNPDGWRRGSVTTGGVFFQRYNGNGVDLNRDWPDIGFSFRPYSTGSEPEVRALGGALREIGQRQKFDGGVDLHGMLTADALSFTLIGHGRHDWAKDTRIRETARNIHVVSEKALAWSPLIVPNNTDKDTMGCFPAVLAEACAQIYGQTWGTVYDTINYTVTGSLGDWLDSPFGLNADGLNNEMAFSHLDRNIVFDPQGEQLHVDGNKALIYAQITSLLNPPNQRYDAPGLKGYIANDRKTREEQQLQDAPPKGTVAQAKLANQNGTPSGNGIVFDFPVKAGPQPDDGSADAGKNIFNGGLRVDITKLNAQGISDGSATTTLKVQCRFCDDHPGAPADGDWITAAEDFNQSPGYAQAGLTVAINRPQTKNRAGQAVEWRAVLEAGGIADAGVQNPIDAGARMDVEFFQGPATLSRDTTGFNPPSLEGYDVANTDLFEDLNKSIDDPNQRFRRIDPKAIAEGRQNLDSYTSIVLADLAPGRDAFLDKLQGWVRDGGNLVLTDSALRMLPEYVDLDAKKIEERKQYVGQLSFQTTDGEDDPSAIRHPLATKPHDVRVQGARFNSGLRRQVYEPTPLGFAIQHAEQTDDANVGDDAFESPMWDVERQAYEDNPGAKTAATSVSDTPDGLDVLLDRTTVGEAVVGKGRVRFIGGVVPQPSQQFDHDFGIEPYSLTYTGHLLLRNALEWPARPIQPDGGEGPGVGGGAGAGGGGPIACTATNRGFRRVDVRGAGRRRLRIGFVRRVRAPITVDVFQTSNNRRRVFQERLVARFRGQFKPLLWNDRKARKGRKVTDGYYFVRLRMNLGAAKADYRRVTLRRKNGRWYKRPPHYRKESCSLLTSYKLLRPVFGGRNGKAVAASYRVTRRARASLTIMRGKRVVRRGRMRVRRADITYRQRLFPRGLPRGDYRFVLRVRPIGGGRTIRSVLTSRRI